MRVRYLMTRAVTTVTPTMTVRDAARLLADHHIVFAPVVANRTVVGAVEERDLQPLCAEDAPSENPECPVNLSRPRPHNVADVMQRSDVPRLSPDDSLCVAATRLALAGSRRGVVFENARLVGVLSTTDIVRALGSDRT